MDENPYQSPRAALREFSAEVPTSVPLRRKVISLLLYGVGSIYVLFGMCVAGYEITTHGVTPLFLYENWNFLIGAGCFYAGWRIRRTKLPASN